MLRALLKFKACYDLNKEQKKLMDDGLLLIANIQDNQSLIFDSIPKLPDSVTL